VEQFISACKEFQVKSEALYLEAYLGLEAGALQWSSSTAMWLQRVRLIAAQTSTVNLYKSRPVPTLSFLTQLY